MSQELLMRKEKRFRIGQMAKLFGLNTQTLHYYDRIGLFKPLDRDPETGYRYYRHSQVYRLGNIVFLRKLNYSITEIMDYFSRQSHQERLLDLVKQVDHIDKEVQRYQFISAALKGKLQYIEQNDYLEKLDTLEIVSVPETSYFEIGDESSLFPSEAYYFFPTVIFYTSQGISFGVTIDNQQTFTSYASLFPHYSSMVNGLKKIPAGETLCGYYTGTYETISQRLSEMRVFAQDHSLVLANNSIHYNIIDQFVESDPSRYITKIHIPIISN